MDGLRADSGAAQFEPHITVVVTVSLTEDDALLKFKSACETLKPYTACVATGTFFYQCVYLLIHPTHEVVKAREHCNGRFGVNNSTPYMPHMSLLYGDLSENEKIKAVEKAISLDEGLSFPVNRLVLCISDTDDKTCKSWRKVAECSLNPNSLLTL